jgi:hypothetical protein
MNFVNDEDPLPRRSILELLVEWTQIPWCYGHVAKLTRYKLKVNDSVVQNWKK